MIAVIDPPLFEFSNVRCEIFESISEINHDISEDTKIYELVEISKKDVMCQLRFLKLAQQAIYKLTNDEKVALRTYWETV